PQNFLACDCDQELLMPPSLREWLPDDPPRLVHLGGRRGARSRALLCRLPRRRPRPRSARPADDGRAPALRLRDRAPLLARARAPAPRTWRCGSWPPTSALTT